MIKIGMLIADRYEVLEKIGTGGMSVVYRAKDHKLNRLVAVKVLKQEFSDNANFVSKFRVEAQAAAGLMHPNIVGVYDVGDEHGTYYIVMELVDGITLKKYIEKKSMLSVREATTIAIQVSNGLEAAHNNHIIHRDIKPQNIMISRDGKVKVTDFGIAKAATSNTITSNVMGSVHYTSPEQARGGYSDERSDIYSLGITIFEMLTGRVPFNGETTVAIAIKHIQTPMPLLSEFVPDIPHSTEQIVMKCCEKSPDRRYQNITELIADLKQSLLHPNDDFVRVINPDEEGATRIPTGREQDEIRHFRESGYTDYPDQDSYADGYDHYGDGYEQGYEQDSYGDSYGQEQDYGYDTYDQSYEETYTPQYQDPYSGGYEDDYRSRRSSSSNKSTRKKAERTSRKERRRSSSMHYSDIDDDYEDSSYSPGRDRTVTIFAVVAAIIVGIIVIIMAARYFDLWPGSSSESVTEEEEVQIRMVPVPDVVGRNMELVRKELQDLGLTPEVEYAESKEFDSGLVISSNVPANTMLEIGSSVILTVSTGENGVEVPDVTGKTVAEAVSILQKKGFKVSRAEAPDPEIEKGLIASQNPAAQMSVPEQSIVTITISTGPDLSELSKVPRIVGLSKEGANAALEAVELVVGTVSEAESDTEAGIVISQSLTEGTYVDPGTTVNYTVSKGRKPTTYAYTQGIVAPTPEEDPNYVPGIAVYVVMFSSDGTKLLDTMAYTFPVPTGFTGLTSPTGSVNMSYMVPGAATETVIHRDLTFSPEE